MTDAEKIILSEIRDFRKEVKDDNNILHKRINDSNKEFDDKYLKLNDKYHIIDKKSLTNKLRQSLFIGGVVICFNGFILICGVILKPLIEKFINHS